MAIHTNEFIVTDIRGSLSGCSITGLKITSSGAGIELLDHTVHTGPSDHSHVVTKGVARCARALPKAERRGNYQYL